MKLLISFLLGVVIGIMLFYVFNHYYNHQDDKIIFNNAKEVMKHDSLLRQYQSDKKTFDSTLIDYQRRVTDSKKRIEILEKEKANICIRNYDDLKKDTSITKDKLLSEITKRDSINNYNKMIIDNKDSIINNTTNSLRKSENIIKEQDAIISEDDTLIDNQNKLINVKQQDIEKLEKNIKRKNLALKIITPIAVVSLILLLL